MNGENRGLSERKKHRARAATAADAGLFPHMQRGASNAKCVRLSAIAPMRVTVCVARSWACRTFAHKESPSLPFSSLYEKKRPLSSLQTCIFVV